jgi:hypothetical protein
MRHAPAVFLGAFPVSSRVLVIKAGENGWGMTTLFEQVFYCLWMPPRLKSLALL